MHHASVGCNLITVHEISNIAGSVTCMDGFGVKCQTLRDGKWPCTGKPARDILSSENDISGPGVCPHIEIWGIKVSPKMQ